MWGTELFEHKSMLKRFESRENIVVMSSLGLNEVEWTLKLRTEGHTVEAPRDAGGMDTECCVVSILTAYYTQCSENADNPNSISGSSLNVNHNIFEALKYSLVVRLHQFGR